VTGHRAVWRHTESCSGRVRDLNSRWWVGFIGQSAPAGAIRCLAFKSKCSFSLFLDGGLTSHRGSLVAMAVSSSNRESMTNRTRHPNQINHPPQPTTPSASPPLPFPLSRPFLSRCGAPSTTVAAPPMPLFQVRQLARAPTHERPWRRPTNEDAELIRRRISTLFVAVARAIN
jgi:hypothetical protein